MGFSSGRFDKRIFRLGKRVINPFGYYSSGLVLTKDTTRSPSFQCPRFLSNSTRSKRLSTFLFLINPPGGLKLGCLLMD